MNPPARIVLVVEEPNHNAIQERLNMEVFHAASRQVLAVITLERCDRHGAVLHRIPDHRTKRTNMPETHITLTLDVANKRKGILVRRIIVDAQRTSLLRRQIGGESRPGNIHGTEFGKDRTHL